MILFLLLAALSASTFTIGKAALAYTTPFFLIGCRVFFAGILFFGYYWLTHKRLPKISSHQFLILTEIAFFSFFAGFILEFWALQYMSSAKTAFLYSLTPFVTAFFSYLVFNEKMTLKKALGLAIGLVGFLPMLITSAPGEGEAFFFISWPELALFGAVICFAYGWVVMRKGLRTHAIPTALVNGIGMLLGGIMAFATAYLFEILPATNKTVWIAPWLPITNLYNFSILALGLIMIGSVACYLLYAYLLKRYTATLLTFAELLTPLFAALYGAIFLGEAINSFLFVSIALLMLGMYIFYQEEKRQGYC